MSAEPIELTAEVAGEMIRSLIRLRGRMQASGPPADHGAETVAISHPDMRCAVEANETGGITLAVMHPGTGWLALPMSRDAARRLLSGIVASLSPEGGSARP